MRKFHRWISAVFGVFLVSSGVTGLLWVYAPYLYWAGGYMEKKAGAISPPIRDAAVPIAAALRILEHNANYSIEAESVLLRRDFGRLLYEIEYKANGNSRRSVVDAQSGDLLSPLSETLAVAAGRQYVAGNPAVGSVALMAKWRHRNKGAAVDAFRVRFEDRGNTEIFIDAATGRILEDQDRTRRFHFRVMQLHQLNFFGFQKVLTVISGLPLLLMIVSGAYLLRRRVTRLRPRWKIRQKHSDTTIARAANHAELDKPRVRTSSRI